MTDWTLATQGLQEFWQGFAIFVPQLILALIVFLVGWIIAAGIGKIIQEILKRAQVDKITKMKKWGKSFEKKPIQHFPE